jgi:hypothetical protein
MLYAGLDFGRKRLDFHLLDDEGATVVVVNRRPAHLVEAYVSHRLLH